MIDGVARWLFDPAGLTAHGFCLLWEPGLIWTHALANVAIGLAYLAMSLAFAICAVRRGDPAFRPLLWLCAAFVACCGMSHWLDLLTLWVPAYGLQAVALAVTAMISIAAAVTMWRLLPRALALPTPVQFQHANENLRQTRAFLERVGEAAGVGGWEVDLLTGGLLWSAETFRIHGVGPDYKPDLETAFAFYAPEARPLLRAAFDRCVATGETWDLELPFIRADGRLIWERAVGMAESDDGRPVRITGAFQDVTYLIAKRLRLLHANERVALATESGGIGIWDWNITDGVMSWDSTMYRLYCADPTTDVPDYAFWRRRLHPDDRAATEQAVHECLTGGKLYDTEFRIIWPDQTVHNIRASARLTRDAAGHATRMIGVNWDVTELRALSGKVTAQAERLAESDARYRLLVETSSDLITHKPSFSGARTYISPACRVMTGYEPEELVGLSARMYVHPDDQARVAADHARLTVTSPDGKSEHRIRHKAGHWVWIEAHLHLLDGGTSLQSIMATARDVTDRHRLDDERQVQVLNLANSHDALERLAGDLARARDAAEQANRAKTHYLATTTHELRTPLNGILGYAQLLRLEGGLTPTQSARVDAMMGAGAHLLQMVQGVLDVSEIETERVDLDIAEVDPRLLSVACLDLVRPGAESKGLTLLLSMALDVPRLVNADPTRLRQVLLNLLGNAVKFTQTGSVELRLRTTADVTALRFEVADSGPGIPADQRHRLFQAFDRLDTQTGGSIEGAGLGLSLTRQLAALMGGQIGHQDNPGGGSIFWLELPVTAATGTTRPAAPSDQTQAPAAGCPLRVLVVDDIAMNRDIAEAFIRTAGHAVTAVESGADAIAAAACADFDVIMMDVRMPEMDGLEATRRIRSLPEGRGQVPIVAMTAQAFTDDVVKCHAAGMDGHLTKPFTVESLLAAVTGGALAGRLTPKARSAARTAPPESTPEREPARADPSGNTEVGAVQGSDLAVLDTAVLAQARSLLTPQAATLRLETLANRCDALLRALRAPRSPAPVDAFAEAAHALVGSAGMLGFVRLASVARRFQHAAESGAAEADDRARDLGAALEATMAHLPITDVQESAAPCPNV